jgi:hypothetical protein
LLGIVGAKFGYPRLYPISLSGETVWNRSVNLAIEKLGIVAKEVDEDTLPDHATLIYFRQC